MILNRFRLDEQVAVVTGGTKGIGRAIALGLAEAGADVAVISRRPHAEIAETILGLGRRYIHHGADLTQREETRGIIPAVTAKMGVASWHLFGGVLFPRGSRIRVNLG